MKIKKGSCRWDFEGFARMVWNPRKHTNLYRRNHDTASLDRLSGEWFDWICKLILFEWRLCRDWLSRRKKAYQGRKIGSQLLATLESEARKKVGYLQVKTVAEASNKDYDRTNDFYRGLGFKKLEIFPQLWNPQNPCQILIKKLE